jgi:hypothetical protein
MFASQMANPRQSLSRRLRRTRQRPVDEWLCSCFGPRSTRAWVRGASCLWFSMRILALGYSRALVLLVVGTRRAELCSRVATAAAMTYDSCIFHLFICAHLWSVVACILSCCMRSQLHLKSVVVLWSVTIYTQSLHLNSVVAFNTQSLHLYSVVACAVSCIIHGQLLREREHILDGIRYQ